MDREAVGEVPGESSHAKITVKMTETSNQTQQYEYQSLADLRMRKEAIRKDMEKDETKFNKLWNSLFHKPDAFSTSASASKRLNSMLSIGMSTVDGAILAWKLYKKFKRK